MKNIATVRKPKTPKIKGTMAFRDEQKKQREKISRILIQGALQLSAEEGYASLSLRSVARKAGIAPTSFYRHFRDMDELGLAIVDQAKGVLRECLKQAAQKMSFPLTEKKPTRKNRLESISSLVRPFVETFLEYVIKNKDLFRLFFQERTGSAAMLRYAINAEIDKSVRYLAEQLEKSGLKPDNGFKATLILAQAMMALAISSGMDMLTRPDNTPDEVAGQLISECSFLLLGAL